MGISGLMTPECLSREGSPGPETYPDNSVPSPAGHLTSQSAPGSPGHPYAPSSQQSHKGRLVQQITVVTNGVSGDAAREGNPINFEYVDTLFNVFAIRMENFFYFFFFCRKILGAW